MHLPPKFYPSLGDATSGVCGGSPVLILGASGRIGQVLRHQVGAGAAMSTELLWRWQARRAPQSVAGKELVDTHSWRLLDPLTAPDALAKAAVGTRAILCLAGPVPGGRAGADADPELLRQHSALALATLDTAARVGEQSGKPPHVFLASSAAVYGAATGLLREDQPLTPLSPYGVAKADMEAVAMERAAELGISMTLLRIGNVAGLDAILGGWRPGFCLDWLPTGLSPRRSYIGVVRLAAVLVLLLWWPERAGSSDEWSPLPQILNIAQPGLVEMAALLSAADLPYERRPARVGAIGEVALDVSRLSNLVMPMAACADIYEGPILPQADPVDLVAEARVLRLLPIR